MDKLVKIRQAAHVGGGIEADHLPGVAGPVPGRKPRPTAQIDDPFDRGETGKLPEQGAPEALSILQPSAAPLGIRVRRVLQIQQQQRSKTATKTFDLKFQEFNGSGQKSKPSVSEVRDSTREEDQKPGKKPRKGRTR